MKIFMIALTFCFLIAEDFKKSYELVKNIKENNKVEKIFKLDIEKLRKSYKPKIIKVLIVGESAPAGGTFFYDKSKMTIYTQKASEKAFLNFFKEQCCYLDDICLTPINNMTNKQRKQMLQNSVVGFSNRLKKYKPKVIIVALKKIVPYANEAIKLSGVKADYYQIPFAGNGHQNKYVKELEEILKKHF